MRRTSRILHVVAAAGLLTAALTGCGLAGGGAGSGADDGDRTITVIATDTPAYYASTATSADRPTLSAPTRSCPG